MSCLKRLPQRVGRRPPLRRSSSHTFLLSAGSRWSNPWDLAPPLVPSSCHVMRVSCAVGTLKQGGCNRLALGPRNLEFPSPLPRTIPEKGEAGDVIIRALDGGATVHNGTKTSS